MSCGKCKHQYCHDEYNALDTCVMATKHIVTPEGVTEDIEVPASEALDKFRKENGGKCPHFVQRRWWNLLQEISRF